MRSAASGIMRCWRWGVQKRRQLSNASRSPLTVGRQSALQPVRDLMQHFGDTRSRLCMTSPAVRPPWALLGWARQRERQPARAAQGPSNSCIFVW